MLAGWGGPARKRPRAPTIPSGRHLARDRAPDVSAHGDEALLVVPFWHRSRGRWLEPRPPLVLAWGTDGIVGSEGLVDGIGRSATLPPKTAKLPIVLSDEVLDALSRTKHIQIHLTSGRPDKAARAAEPRPGALPAKILAWAETRKEPFQTADVKRRFKLSRAHASMLLSNLASGPHPIEREGRGVYVYGG